MHVRVEVEAKTLPGGQKKKRTAVSHECLRILRLACEHKPYSCIYSGT